MEYTIIIVVLFVLVCFGYQLLRVADNRYSDLRSSYRELQRAQHVLTPRMVVLQEYPHVSARRLRKMLRKQHVRTWEEVNYRKRFPMRKQVADVLEQLTALLSMRTGPVTPYIKEQSLHAINKLRTVSYPSLEDSIHGTGPNR
jgi:hypothetical protein